MKTFDFLLIIIASISLALLSSCGSDEDTQPPSIYFLNSDGNVISDTDAEKTILLLSKYVDSGIQVEDNVSDVDNIIVGNDIFEVLSTNTFGQVKRTGEYIITYSAKDEAQNVGTKTKKIIVKNISTPFTGAYSTERTNSEIAETLYNSNVTADSQISGRLIFPKVYAQMFNGDASSFRLVADLFSQNYSPNFSETFAYTGTADDPELAFYARLDYEEALDSIMSFDLLKIAAQEFTDDFGNDVQIAGRELDNLPLSRIEYVAGTKNISRVVLELNVTFNGVPDSHVIEIYTPQ